MRKTLWMMVLTAGLVGASLDAEAVSSRVGNAEDLGIGVAVGQPMGATMKYWMSSTTALDAFAGYHFNDNFDLHADLLWHSFSSFRVAQGRLPFYLGGGARLLAGDDTQFGIRFPLGLSYLMATDPLEFFFELAPVVEIAPDIDADLDVMLGIRLYINYIR